MALRTSTLGLRLIDHCEGNELVGYLCPAGVPTIGRGHTEAAGGVIRYLDGTVSTKVFVGKPITEAESWRLFLADIDRFEDGLERLLGPELLARLKPYQYDALVSLSQNIGLTLFGKSFKSGVLACLRRGEFDKVPAAIRRFCYAKGKKLPGLVKRRDAEAFLFDGNLAQAEALLGVDLGDMPQAVDAPAPPKTMAQSRTGWSAIVTGAGATVAAAKGGLELAREASDVARQAADFLGALVANPAALVLMGAIGVACAVWIFVDRRRKLREELV